MIEETPHFHYARWVICISPTRAGAPKIAQTAGSATIDIGWVEEAEEDE